VVSSEFTLLGQPVNGGGPIRCAPTPLRWLRLRPKNQRMVGVLVTFGASRSSILPISTGRRRWSCRVRSTKRPRQPHQTSRHGSFDGAGAPAFLGAIRPQVIVVNNGPARVWANRTTA